MLCFRCEKRAVFLEKGYAPRSECKDVDRTIDICYCYSPVKPVSQKYPDYDGEYDKINKKRPPIGSLIGARMVAKEICDCSLELHKENETYTQWWKPKSSQICTKDGTKEKEDETQTT